PIAEEDVVIGKSNRSIYFARCPEIIAVLLHAPLQLREGCTVACSRGTVGNVSFLVMYAPAVTSFLDTLGFHYVATARNALRIVLRVGGSRNVVAQWNRDAHKGTEIAVVLEILEEAGEHRGITKDSASVRQAGDAV